jgi:hypothetical protein
VGRPLAEVRRIRDELDLLINELLADLSVSIDG